MLCSRSASLMTSTRMSRLIATIILRMVSAWAVSPYLTLSSLVTPSTSWATSAPKSLRSSSSVYGVSSTVSCSRAATRVGSVMPMSARIVVTASGWVMYGSPLLRTCEAWHRSAVRYARSSSSRSALGWFARTARKSGSRTGFSDWDFVAIRASRARIRRPAGPAAVDPRSRACVGGVRTAGAGLSDPGTVGGCSGALVGGLTTPLSATMNSSKVRSHPILRRDRRGSYGLQHLEPQVPDGVAPVQEGQLDQHRQRVRDSSAPLDQLTGRVRGPSGGQDVVDEQHALPHVDAVRVHLQGRRAVLERVGARVGLPGQLPGFAARDEAGAERQGQGCREDEAASLHSAPLVDPHVAVGVAARRSEGVDHHRQALVVGQQRGDVLEHHAALRVVRDVPDELDQQLAERRHGAHPLPRWDRGLREGWERFAAAEGDTGRDAGRSPAVDRGVRTAGAAGTPAPPRAPGGPPPGAPPPLASSGGGASPP